MLHAERVRLLGFDRPVRANLPALSTSRVLRAFRLGLGAGRTAVVRSSAPALVHVFRAVGGALLPAEQSGQRHLVPGHRRLGVPLISREAPNDELPLGDDRRHGLLTRGGICFPRAGQNLQLPSNQIHR